MHRRYWLPLHSFIHSSKVGIRVLAQPGPPALRLVRVRLLGLCSSSCRFRPLPAIHSSGNSEPSERGSFPLVVAPPPGGSAATRHLDLLPRGNEGRCSLRTFGRCAQPPPRYCECYYVTIASRMQGSTKSVTTKAVPSGGQGYCCRWPNRLPYCT